MNGFEFLLAAWLGMPVWIWLAFVGTVLLLLAFDLGVLHRETHEVGVRESLWMSALYIGLGLAWAVAVWWIYAAYGGPDSIDEQIAGAATAGERGWTAVKLYVTGYLVEKTLAMDNVFVISMIFTYFAIPRMYQHRVLIWGILGVIVLRAVMIGLGAALVIQFAWIMIFFAVLLIATGVKMLAVIDHKPDIARNPVLRLLRSRLRVTGELHGERFFVRLPDPATGAVVTWATPLFLCLVLVEVADLIFAIDSVPAIFAITPDPFIVYTSNIFAILGLRALYFALAAMVHRFYYLKYALALVLIFIGAKIILGDFVWSGKMPAEWSLAVTATLLAGGVLYSLWKTRGAPPPAPAPAPQRAAQGAGVGAAMTTAYMTTTPGASIEEAASAMAASGAASLVVVGDRGEPLGIVTEGDLIQREALGRAPGTPLWRTLFTDDRTLARAFAKAYGRTVADVMSRELRTVTEDTAIAHAAQLLYSHGVKQLPVVRDGVVVGVVSRSDVICALGRLGAELVTETADDDAIADEIGTRISRAGWISPQQVRYAVNDGHVEYSGVVTSEDQRRALHALAEGVPGVRRVFDRLRVTGALAARTA